MGAADMASLVEDSSDAKVQALSVPAWCQYVLAGEQSEACRGSDAKGCTCDGSCAQVPANSWMWNPQCCGCSVTKTAKIASNTAHNAGSIETQNVSTTWSPVAMAAPAWCQYVPNGQKSVACRGSSASGCTCESFCAQVPGNTWQWNPECCGCGKGASLKAAAEMLSLVQDSAEPKVKVLSVPAWCQYVPAGEKSVACRGSDAKGCTCEGLCAQVPANTWMWNPQCCGCGQSNGSKQVALRGSLSP